jgi:hypothetical protein
MSAAQRRNDAEDVHVLAGNAVNRLRIISCIGDDLAQRLSRRPSPGVKQHRRKVRMIRAAARATV